MPLMSNSRLARSASAGILNASKDSSLGGRKSYSPHTPYYSIPFEVAYREIAEQRNFRRLEMLFKEVDADGSGEMSLDEFRDALRKPWIQRSFSLLGVQPHQAEVVFKSMKQSPSGEISIHDFMHGLEELVGADLDGPPMDLDVEKLRPSFKTKERLFRMSGHMNGGGTMSVPMSPASPTSPTSPTSPLSPSAMSQSPLSPGAASSGMFSRRLLPRSASSPGLGDFSLTDTQFPCLQSPSTDGPDDEGCLVSPSGIFFKDRQTFTHTATAKALHSATAYSANAERRRLGRGR
eukprot:TRINITY_DN80524_c0_g1_i1.p1 TRINITY_DN80524_c0_g1~~TRINITY_DN80524_c0_g1_i1.p1  ORF type:complete len:292 (+),score=40.01 TRINITY_DN80524_c0_g1_i1:61-936(+)